jgi:hypothetical protein
LTCLPSPSGTQLLSALALCTRFCTRFWLDALIPIPCGLLWIIEKKKNTSPHRDGLELWPLGHKNASEGQWRSKKSESVLRCVIIKSALTDRFLAIAQFWGGPLSRQLGHRNDEEKSSLGIWLAWVVPTIV